MAEPRLKNMTNLFLAQIAAASVFRVIIWLIVAGLIFWLLTWLISYVGLPEPFAKVAKVILAVAAVIVIIDVLLSLTGHGFITFN